MVSRQDLFDVKKRSYKDLQQISGDKIGPGGGRYGSCLGEIDANCKAGVCLDAPRPHTCTRPPVMSLSLTARRSAPRSIAAHSRNSGTECLLETSLQSLCRATVPALLPRSPQPLAPSKTSPQGDEKQESVLNSRHQVHEN